MAENSVVQPQRLARWDGTTVAPGDVVAFDGRRGPLFRLVLKNIVLTVLTLGIYRFWAKRAVRHWFWRHVSIAEERLEYTGKGTELFVGFLIAMCVLLPFFAVTSILEQMARTSVVGAVISQTVYFVGLFLLIQTAIFRMRPNASPARCGVAFAAASTARHGIMWRPRCVIGFTWLRLSVSPIPGCAWD
jgi:uncharacterized membrane protein YjgN (DUF898 family)